MKEIKTTKEIGEDYNFSTKDHSERIKKEWVALDDPAKIFVAPDKNAYGEP